MPTSGFIRLYLEIKSNSFTKYWNKICYSHMEVPSGMLVKKFNNLLEGKGISPGLKMSQFLWCNTPTMADFKMI